MDHLQSRSPQNGTGIKMGTQADDTARNDDKSFFLAHYRLERELGRGFSSIVFAAQDLRRHRIVALKVLTFLQTLDEGRRKDLAERFRRESEAVSALSHPNIVAIYEVGQSEDGRQFIAMECLPGETLRQRLNHAAPLSIPEALAIGVRVAEALHYAHGRGIIHRDIKPDNIFLAQGGEESTTPKLMDFGIAHVLSDQALTQEGTIVGSPAYMSPEQIHGLPLDARTDVFSMAVTLTEMVTGAKPFEAETIPAVMQKILHHAPDLRAVADRNLQRVLAKALAKHPSARYPDAAAFAQALRQTTPFAAPAPSVATQVLAASAQNLLPARSSPRTILAAIGVGGLALAVLAALPQIPEQSRSAAPGTGPVSPPPSVSAVHSEPVRQDPMPLEFWARRHEISIARHPASRHLALRTGDASIVQITEVKPRRSAPPPHPPSTWISHLAHTSEKATVPEVTAIPTASSRIIRRKLPLRIASARLAAIPRGTATVPKPIIRLAESRQVLSKTPITTTLTNAPPRPVYQPMPRAADGLERTEAIVRLRLSIDENGDVTEATILDSSGDRALDDAALDAVGHWEYDPALQDGQNVPGVVIATVKFAPW